MRATKQTAEIVEKTISEIRKLRKKTNELISEICQKNKINESHIREVGGFKYQIK